MTDTSENASLISSDHSIPDDNAQYVVVARRYRPQNFTDLVGQSQASTALKNAITQNRVGHAYLFTGARGVGKTSTARIFAKCLNCATGPTTDPCDQCDICQSIATGEDVDVIEIDGASNRGIDEIRQLRSNANIRPGRAKFKVYIIDEVHMLTQQAFNALLKTLEEPPGHVKFIFCTTDPEKIPITVLSRCQRFDFVPVKLDAIKQRLGEIVANENLEADDEALTLLARRAGGSMRDSQSLLEQVLSYCDGRITLQNVHDLLGTADNESVYLIGKYLTQCDSGSALTEIHKAFENGVDAGQLAEQLVAFFRDQLVLKAGASQEILHAATASEIEQLNELVSETSVDFLMATIQILDQSISRMRYSGHTRVLIELAAVRICQLDSIHELAGLIENVKNGKSIVTSAASPPLKKNDLTERADLPHDQAPDRPTMATKITDQNVRSIWSQVLEQLADVSAEMAREFQTLSVEAPNRLVVGIPDQTKCDFCSQANRKAKFEELLENIAGTRYSIEFKTIDQPVNVATARTPAKPMRQLQKELAQNPLVESAIQYFEGEIVDIQRPRSSS